MKRSARELEIEALGDGLPITFARFNHPIVQRAAWGFPEPYGWQAALWDASWRPGAQVAAAVCNEGGKGTMVIPNLALSFAAAFPGAMVVITSASQRQLDEQDAPALRNAVRRQPNWKYTDGKITGPSIDGLPGSDIIWFVTKDPNRFEGFHVRLFEDDFGVQRYGPLLIIADEAKSINAEFFEAMHRCNPTVLVYISSTGEDSGDFYEACMNHDGLWTTGWDMEGTHYRFSQDGIDWTQCPHLLRGHTYRRKKALLDRRGENDPLVCSQLLARFFRSGMHMAFDDLDKDRARTAMSGVIPRVGRERRAHCDFGAGGDPSTFGVRDGNLIHPIVSWIDDAKTVTASQIAVKYIRLFKQWSLSSEQITGDVGGLGQLIMNALAEHGWGIGRVHHNEKAIESASYVDEYTELHWRFKENLQNNMLILPADDELLEEMRKRRYLIRNTDENRIRMEPKEEARRQRREHSPNKLETVIYLCRNMEPMPQPEKARNTAPRCGTPKEYYEEMDKEKAREEGHPLFGNWPT